MVFKLWMLKAIVQKVISYLPFSQRINYWFQKHITKGVRLSDQYYFDKLGHARDHISSYQKHKQEAPIGACLEIGSGWYPIIPVCYFLCGAERIYTVDISPLSNRENLIQTIDRIIQHGADLKNFIPYQADRLDSLQSIREHADQHDYTSLLAQLNIQYLIQDARQLNLEGASIDLISSNNTFEHIYPEILAPILLEFKRILKPAGLMSHFIDMSDHFAHLDQSIGIYNFLQFSERQWALIDNSIQPQSRLRYDDYKSMYADLQIAIHDEWHRPGNPAGLNELNLDPRFAQKPSSINAISHCHFVSIKH